MTTFKGKKNKVKVLNPKKLLQHYTTAILSFCLTGCMGVYEGGFECPPGTGVGCKSISEVNEMINQETLPLSKRREERPETDTKDQRHPCHGNSPDACPLRPDSRYWVAPWALMEV